MSTFIDLGSILGQCHMASVYYIPKCVSNLGAELVDLSVLMTGNDKLSQRSPHSAGNLVVAAG